MFFLMSCFDVFMSFVFFDVFCMFFDAFFEVSDGFLIFLDFSKKKVLMLYVFFS